MASLGDGISTMDVQGFGSASDEGEGCACISSGLWKHEEKFGTEAHLVTEKLSKIRKESARSAKTTMKAPH